MKYKILVVEDDESIAASVCEHLRKWDFDAFCATDFKNVAATAAKTEPHLILMDVMLPYFNGFYNCSQIRAFSKAPIIFISSASDNMNIVMALNMGGDDFVQKPFDFSVLTAKIQAMLRRTYAFREQLNVLECEGLVLNLSDATASYNEKKIELTKNDFKIMNILMENAGHYVSRDELMRQLWASDEFIDDNTLTVNVTRLRRKLSEIGLDDFIKTKKGIGYIIG